jgi:acetylornithine deacetylase/succinyl-diaminopimelate desuccinylase-like protein
VLHLYAGVKGILYIELRTQGAAYDLHSSNAPLAPNAVWRLIAALSTLRAEDGRIRIPHFYDDVVAPTEREREVMERFPVNTDAYQKSWETNILPGPADSQTTPTERLFYSPTCNICGIWGGYSGSGSKTIIPATAGVKIDFRLVPHQDPQTILSHLRRYLVDQGFGDVEVVELEGTEHPAQSSIDTPLVEALRRSARTIYGNEPSIQPRTAGTGPMEALCQRYGIPAIGGAGVGYSNSRNHAPDENIRVDDFILGIKHVAALLAEFAAL